MNCRHCHRRKASRPRGLCFRCYCTPDVRGLYPPQQGFQPKPEPTAEEVEAAIAERAANLPAWYRKEQREQLKRELNDMTAGEVERERTERFKARTRVPRQWR